MRYILLLFSGLLFSFSAYAQDLNYEEVSQAFSHKELPKSKQIKSYQAIDNKVYSIGDKLEIGYPKDGKQFSYISNAPSNLPTSVVTIQSFTVMSTMAGSGSAIGIGAVVLSIDNNKALFINNIDLALEYGEVVRTTKSNVTNFQEMAPNSSSQITTNHTNYQAIDKNTVEQVAIQDASNQPVQGTNAGVEQKMVYFDSPTSETSTSVGATQPNSNKFGYGASRKSGLSNNSVNGPKTRGYGGMVMMDFGFDVHSIGLSLGISMVNGYHFNSHWYVGGGIGVLLSVGDYDSTFGIPIFAYGQYTFNSRGRIIPYVSLGTGTNIEFTYLEGGTYFNPAGGILIKMKNEKQQVKVGVSVPMDFLHVIGLGLQVGYSF